jgi:hypothetical protein
MQGKSYSTNSSDGAGLWDQLDGVVATTTTGLAESNQARFGEPTLIAPRLGQGAFRVVITELYGRQCALTDGKVLPALDAAHIVPYAEGGSHSKTNGILLRKDIHGVFDAGYATLDSDYRFVVSQKVREVFNNGSEHLQLHGTRLRLPANPLDHPDKAALRARKKAQITQTEVSRWPRRRRRVPLGQREQGRSRRTRPCPQGVALALCWCPKSEQRVGGRLQDTSYPDEGRQIRLASPTRIVAVVSLCEVSGLRRVRRRRALRRRAFRWPDGNVRGGSLQTAIPTLLWSVRGRS